MHIGILHLSRKKIAFFGPSFVYQHNILHVNFGFSFIKTNFTIYGSINILLWKPLANTKMKERQHANGYNTELTCQWHFRGVDADHLNYLNEKSIVIVIIFGYIWNFIC